MEISGPRTNIKKLCRYAALSSLSTFGLSRALGPFLLGAINRAGQGGSPRQHL